MSFERRKIKKQLNKLEKKYLIEKQEAAIHQFYLMGFYNQYRTIIWVAVTPLAFIMLYANRSKMKVKQVGRYSRYLLMSIITGIQAQIVSTILDKSINKIRE